MSKYRVGVGEADDLLARVKVLLLSRLTAPSVKSLVIASSLSLHRHRIRVSRMSGLYLVGVLVCRRGAIHAYLHAVFLNFLGKIKGFVFYRSVPLLQVSPVRVGLGPSRRVPAEYIWFVPGAIGGSLLPTSSTTQGPGVNGVDLSHAKG